MFEDLIPKNQKATTTGYLSKTGADMFSDLKPKTGFVQSVAQDIAKSPLRVVSTVRKIGDDVGSLVKNYEEYKAQKGDTGLFTIDDLWNDIKNDNYGTKEAAQNYTPTKKEYDYGYFGKTNNITNAKEAAGVAASIASNFVGVGALGNASKTIGGSILSRTLPTVANVVKKVAVPGAIAGGMYGGGEAASEGKNAGDIALETGANAALGAAGGVVLAGISPVAKMLGKGGQAAFKALTYTDEMKAKEKLTNIVNDRVAAISQIENNYSSLRKAKNLKDDVGEASRKRVAMTDVLVNAVNDDGLVLTKQKGGAYDQYKAMTLDSAENTVRKNLARLGETTTLDELEAKMTKAVANSGLEGADLETALKSIKKEIKGLSYRATPTGRIPLVAIHDAKVNQYGNINWNTAPQEQKYRRAVANALKTEIENKSNFNVKEVNAEIGKYLEDLSLIEKLDGKRVKGGKLGKYMAQVSGNVIGAGAGSIFGPLGSALGSVLGGEASSAIKGGIMKNTFGKATGGKAEISDVLKSAIARGDLPGPADSTYMRGNLNTKYATTKMNTTNAISGSVAPQSLKDKTPVLDELGNIIPEASAADAPGLSQALTNRYAKEDIEKQINEIQEGLPYKDSKTFREYRDSIFNENADLAGRLSGIDKRSKDGLDELLQGNNGSKTAKLFDEYAAQLGYSDADYNAGMDSYDFLKKVVETYRKEVDNYNYYQNKVSALKKQAKNVDRLVSEEAYQTATKNLKEKLSSMNSGVRVDAIPDMVVVAAYHVENGVKSAVELGARLAKEGYELTKEQIDNLFNTANLTNEAKKYKSAEEFVKDNEYVYHGTNYNGIRGIQETGLDTAKAKSKGNNIFYTQNEKYAKTYSDARGAGNGFVLAVKRPKDIGIDTGASNAKGKTPDLISKQAISPEDILIKGKDDKWYGIKDFNPFYGEEGSLIGKNPITLKTKPQLTDIWNKANGSAKNLAAAPLVGVSAEGIMQSYKDGSLSGGSLDSDAYYSNDYLNNMANKDGNTLDTSLLKKDEVKKVEEPVTKILLHSDPQTKDFQGKKIYSTNTTVYDKGRVKIGEVFNPKLKAVSDIVVPDKTNPLYSKFDAQIKKSIEKLNASTTKDKVAHNINPNLIKAVIFAESEGGKYSAKPDDTGLSFLAGIEKKTGDDFENRIAKKYKGINFNKNSPEGIINRVVYLAYDKAAINNDKGEASSFLPITSFYRDGWNVSNGGGSSKDLKNERFKLIYNYFNGDKAK